MFRVFHNIISVINSLTIDEHTDNFIPLVDVICSREENVSANHFAHYTTNWPKVNILFVSHTKNNLIKIS